MSEPSKDVVHRIEMATLECETHDEVVEALALLLDRVVAEERENMNADLNHAANSVCSCGGRGFDDPLACSACLVVHSFRLLRERKRCD